MLKMISRNVLANYDQRKQVGFPCERELLSSKLDYSNRREFVRERLNSKATHTSAKEVCPAFSNGTSGKNYRVTFKLEICHWFWEEENFLFSFRRRKHNFVTLTGTSLSSLKHRFIYNLSNIDSSNKFWKLSIAQVNEFLQELSLLNRWVGKQKWIPLESTNSSMISCVLVPKRALMLSCKLEQFFCGRKFFTSCQNSVRLIFN